MATKRRLRFQITVLVIVIGALGLTALAPARQAFSQRQRIEAEKAKLAALQRENAALQERLGRLNDPDYVEKLAREQLGLVKPDEVAYVMVSPDPVTSTVKAPPPKPKPWYQKAWRWAKTLGRGD